MLSTNIWCFLFITFSLASALASTSRNWPGPRPWPQSSSLDLGLRTLALASVSALRFWPRLTSLSQWRWPELISHPYFTHVPAISFHPFNGWAAITLGFATHSSFSLLRWCCLAKITTMRFNFLKLLGRILLVSFPAAVHDNVVSNDVTITSSLRSCVIILGINFLFY